MAKRRARQTSLLWIYWRIKGSRWRRSWPRNCSRYVVCSGRAQRRRKIWGQGCTDIWSTKSSLQGNIQDDCLKTRKGLRYV